MGLMKEIDWSRWHSATERFAVEARNIEVWAESVARTLRVFHFEPPGYYVRDGKLRRDHAYFRQRARDRRAAAKRQRQAARTTV